MKTKNLFSSFTGAGIRLIVFVALMITIIGNVTSAAAAPVSIDLCATPGSVTMPDGTTVTIWSYVAGDCTGNPSAVLPGGPTMDVNEGDVVTVNLYNNLSEATALLFQGQAMAPDLFGAGPGASTSYTFTASVPGTYLYEAGLLNNAQHQVAMGLYGALIVRSATPGQAYDSASTAFNDEAALLLSEIDPALNNAGNPAGFDMRQYHPNFWLINGKAYPQTASIPTVAGNNVLLRYINAGLQPHSMGALGLQQNIIAIDGSLLNYSRNAVTESIAPGRTMDVIASIPASASSGSMFALFEANFLQHNNNAAGFGGMLTFLTLGAPLASTGGPAVSAVVLTPSVTNGSGDVALSATVSDVSSGGSNIQAAEFYIDNTSGAPVAMLPVDVFDASMESVQATIAIADMTGLSAGSHTIYVRGQDADNNWGAFNSALLNLDKAGPATTAITLNKNPSNGSVDVTLSATADDSAHGNTNISAAEYNIDGGTASPLTVGNTAVALTSLTTVIPAAVIDALPEGSHTVTIWSQDALGNWGDPATINLVVDKTGPLTSNVGASPNPNNGLQGFNSSTPAVRMTASFADAPAKLSAAEGFIDTVGANGAGFPFIATDGVFNNLSETGYADIPLTTIRALSNGPHTFYVHAKDAAGNWGDTGPILFILDKLPPSVSGLTLNPAAANNTAVAVSATANDVTTGNTNIVAAEYFIDTVGVAGTGFSMIPGAASPNTTITANIPSGVISALTAGNHKIYVRAKDAVGNWSALSDLTFLIDRTAPTFTGITLTPTSIPAGTASVNLIVNGAADPLVSGLASGVAGGEYWFGATNIPAGTGLAFNGLTPSITTGSLAIGTYTVRVRVRDVAGNWSIGANGVRTATLSVTGDTTPPVISNVTVSPNPTFGATTITATVTASDNIGGSGLNGGQYWFDGSSSTPPPGNVSFSGTTSPIAVSGINVNALSIGSHNLRVRVKDFTGNFSAVVTRQFTVVPDAIFADGFESPTTLPGNWSSRSTGNTSRLNVTGAAALSGSFGLQAQGNTGNYVQFNFGTGANPATGTYDARFFFDPNGNTSTGQDILAAATSSGFGTQLFHARYRVNLGQPQVQIQVGNIANGTWTNITNAVHKIEVVWESGSSLQLYVDGVLAQTISASTGIVGSVRMGSVTSGNDSALMFFDAFASKRSIATLYLRPRK